MEYSITHNELTSRFETIEGGHHAYVEYRLTGNVMDIRHTWVPRELEGKGLGSALTKYALDYAKGKGLKVIPTCPFTKTYIDRHAEYQGLL